MLGFDDSYKYRGDIGCMEGTSLGVSKIYIKAIHEETILGCKEVCDEYSPLGISEWISEKFKDVPLLGLIEITMLGHTNSSKLGEELGYYYN